MANTYLYDGTAFVQLGNLGPPVIDPGTPPAGGPIAKPDASNTGPRTTVTGSTLSSGAAKSLAAANGGIVQGRRIANLTLSAPTDWQFQWVDCEIEGAYYGVDAWFGQGVVPSNPSNRAVFQNCLFDRADAALIAGTNYVLRNCEMRRGVDLAKSFGNTEIFGCYMHSLWDPGGAHGDVFQAQNGNDIVLHWNTISCINAADSPSRAGEHGSGGTQFGIPFGNLTNVKVWDNWANGGAYTLRGGETWLGAGGVPFQLSLSFRRNKHGRGWIYGPFTGMGSFDSGRAISDYDSSNVFEDTGLPVQG